MESFLGYERKDGTVGTRNYVAIIPTVSCANGVVAAIAGAVPEATPLYHGHGCGRGGADLVLHTKTLQNLALNPNVAAFLVIGLGCEFINPVGLEMVAAMANKPVKTLIIQKEGGTRNTTEKGIQLAKELLAEVGKIPMAACPLDKLIVGLECGGSDSFSGISANPAVGIASDWVVDNGGTVILTETTEMIGTNHILKKRAATPEVAQQIDTIINDTDKVAWAVLGPLAKVSIAPGNMDGGMSSIREKSLGCIAKAGNRPIAQVVSYGERPREKGVIIMDGPGYDTESMTGVAASGAQVMLFTTGRGQPIGYPIVPVIKIASNSALYRNMADDMDINAGSILEGRSIEDVGHEIVEILKRVISGQQTRAEINRQTGIICMYTQHTSF
ncbi:MAG: altronate dehydratase [Spirochaetes bacterium]|nr:MAG: altronate dehydratase [Spirochaetota bacterium]